METEEFRTVHAEGMDIVYAVRHGGRRRRRLSIVVHRDARVEVLLPAGSSVAEAEKAVARRAEWIAGHVRQARASRYLPEGVDGFFLGEPYRLDILASRSWEGVSLAPSTDGGIRRIVVSARNPGKAARLMKAWFEERARAIVSNRFAVLLPAIPWLEAAPPWRVRTMRSRWGSCSARGVLTLNARLLQAPVRCIDFVILHEICHLRQLNHSPAFYAELAALLPAWEARRDELNRYPL